MSEKLNTIRNSDSYLDVTFNQDEVKVVNDLTQLRFLKLSKTFPENFQTDTNIFSCFTKIKERDNSIESLYLVLEFFALRNPFLQTNVNRVFHRNGLSFEQGGIAKLFQFSPEI